jgi:glycosyltransferase involved in cell wall biosynthesis
MSDLSIIIPSRNEMFLARTVEDILSNIEGDTDIIIVLDGEWADPPVAVNPRVTVVYHPESVGQRAAMNEAVSLSQSKYILKCDAHCAFDKGFDVKLMADMQDDWTVVPTMRNLHAFNWVCDKCGDSRYQGPTPTSCNATGCDSLSFHKDVVWIAKTNPQSNSYCFDSEPHFQYFGDWSKRPGGKGDLTETMSLQGSAFMCTREKYWELGLADENFGSWGSQGIEVAVKTWLSGGRVMVNHKTWYAHMFRTQGGDFGFPYHLSGKQVDNAKKFAKDLFFNNKWDKQVRPLSWLLERFWPVPGWTQEQLDALKSESNFTINTTLSSKIKLESKGIVYYTENRLDPKIMKACQVQLAKSNLPITSVSLKPIDFGDNVVLDLERGYLTMFKQILAGLEESKADIIFFAEHDILYHPEHFEFTPKEKDVYYYNENIYHLDVTGKCVFYYAKRLSQICAYRELLIEHFRKRVQNTASKLEELGNSHAFGNFIRGQGFEPGTHGRPERVDNFKASDWFGTYPNIDIKHTTNLTKARWNQEEFRDQRNCRGFREVTEIPYWGNAKALAESFRSNNDR